MLKIDAALAPEDNRLLQQVPRLSAPSGRQGSKPTALCYLFPYSLYFGSSAIRAASTTSAAHSTSAPSRCAICSQTGARKATSRKPSTYCAEKNEHQRGKAAVVPVRPVLRRSHQQPDEKDACHKSNGRMRPAPAHQPAARRREILRHCGAQRACREKRVAQRGQRSGYANDQHHDDRRHRAEWRNKADPAAQVSRSAAEQVCGECQRRQQQQRVGQVQRQVRRAQGRPALRSQAELDQERSQGRFNHCESTAATAAPRARWPRAVPARSTRAAPRP